MRTGKKYSVMACMAVISMSGMTFAQTQLTQEDKELESRILQAEPLKSLKIKNMGVDLSATELNKFWDLAEKAKVGCQDHRKILFESKYVLTLDASGQPCRIYDLSFPNLQAFMSNKPLLQVPVRKLTSRDFLDALDQNWPALQERNREFAMQFKAQSVVQNSFVSDLKFKMQPRFVPGSQLGNTGLPASFSLGDLKLSSPLTLSESLKADFDKLLRRIDEPSSDVAASVVSSHDLYRRLVSRPEVLLNAVRFEWNDMDKVYNVILDGRFLPFLGPVEVLNFQEQYRSSIERMTRNLVGQVLSQAARFIPDPTLSAIVEVAIEDVFEQIDLMYRYQNLRLEQVLSSMNTRVLAADSSDAQKILQTRALHLLHGQRSDLISNYVMAAVQGREFDWQGVEKLGAINRYNAEKQRKLLMAKMNSRLVLEKKCETELLSAYFAICSKEGQKDGVYSLISEQKLPFKSFGAPLVYRYGNPSLVSWVRGGTWLLSAGLRIVGLPLSRGITNQLDSFLKAFMQSGILDEALLQSYLLQMNSKTTLPADSQSLLDWLYIQNLNPFLPKSIKGEQRMIDGNKQLMGRIEEA